MSEAHPEPLPLLLRRASRIDHETVRKASLKAGMTEAVYLVLLALRGKPEGESVGALARATALRQPTVSKVVTGLDAAKAATRRAGPLDLRVSIVTLTPSGAAWADQAHRTALAHESRIVGRSPALARPEARAMLLTALR